MICLDITRLISRAGRGPFTGIDRVEYACLTGLLARDIDLCGLVRLASGYAILDRPGLGAMRDRIDGVLPWGAPDLRARLSRLSPERQCAEADVRRHASATCARLGLARQLGRQSFRAYLNVGHSNLTERSLGAVGRAGGKSVVYVHDTIPLDWPDHHRPGMPESFAARMRAVGEHADLILCPSHHTAGRIEVHLGREAMVVPPGFNPPMAPPREATEPYFVCLGTIDARKNQALLLDVWDALGADAPNLYLIGRRGWCPPDLARRLEALPSNVKEWSGLSDAEVLARLAGARALLHPSLAEGYGFTLLEAASLGVPVVAGDLEVYRETLGNEGIYLDLDDRYQWVSTIQSLADTQKTGRQRQAHHRWDAHLDHVLSVV